jgi:hypothetical protein
MICWLAYNTNCMHFQPPAIPPLHSKHPLLQHWKYTQTHTRATKLSSPMPLLWLTAPFCSSLSITFTNYQVSITSWTTISPSTPTVYRHYNQGGFYIRCKQLVWYWTCEFVITNLYIHAGDKKEYINLTNNQVSHNTKIKSKERKQAIKTTN